ncbi:hypothetical protein LguiB_018750 [Lonicera macranthoides]
MDQLRQSIAERSAATASRGAPDHEVAPPPLELQLITAQAAMTAAVEASISSFEASNPTPPPVEGGSDSTPPAPITLPIETQINIIQGEVGVRRGTVIRCLGIGFRRVPRSKGGVRTTNWSRSSGPPWQECNRNENKRPKKCDDSRQNDNEQMKNNNGQMKNNNERWKTWKLDSGCFLEGMLPVARLLPANGHNCLGLQEGALKEKIEILGTNAAVCSSFHELRMVVEETGCGGYLKTNPSTSPEHPFIATDSRRASVSYSLTMDIVNIREVFSAVIYSAKVNSISISAECFLFYALVSSCSPSVHLNSQFSRGDAFFGDRREKCGAQVVWRRKKKMTKKMEED